MNVKVHGRNISNSSDVLYIQNFEFVANDRNSKLNACHANPEF